MSGSAEEDVMRIRKKLENVTEQIKEVGSKGDSGQALDLLKSLNEAKMNLQILKKTRIGMTVNALRKTSQDEEVVTLAKNLIKAWKKFLPDNSGSGSSEKEKKEIYIYKVTFVMVYQINPYINPRDPHSEEVPSRV